MQQKGTSMKPTTDAIYVHIEREWGSFLFIRSASLSRHAKRMTAHGWEIPYVRWARLGFICFGSKSASELVLQSMHSLCVRKWFVQHPLELAGGGGVAEPLGGKAGRFFLAIFLAKGKEMYKLWYFAQRSVSSSSSSGSSLANIIVLHVPSRG